MQFEPTISKIYKYKPIKPYIGLEGRIPVRNKDVYVGVEIELEGISGYYTNSSFNHVEDHSLKYYGGEFVTVPVKMRYLEVELDRLLKGITYTISNPVSSRCSTHVHMNVRDMTVEQVVNLILLYMIFERSLYRVSGDRWTNNYCIPLTMATDKPQVVLKYFYSVSSWSWYKYLGLNISPIFGGESSKIGTVEFRQLHGTTSVKEIIDWCNLVTSLKRAAQKITQEELIAHIRTMNTTSGYWWLAKEVFGPYRRAITEQPTFASDVERCIGVVKSIMPKKLLGYVEKAVAVDKPKVMYSGSSNATTFIYSSDITWKVVDGIIISEPL